MDLLVTPIIGGVVGWLASVLTRTNAQMGIAANVFVGIVGSFLGVAIANAMGVTHQGALASLFVAVLGAALLIALWAVAVFSRFSTAR